MNFIDLIDKKRQGLFYTQEEIDYIVKSFVDSKITRAQMAAWLTVVTEKNLALDETVWLTTALANSGVCIDFSKYAEVVIDKHSTGGVGDKVTMTLIPLLASAGVKVAKIADRTVGNCAGTLDKFESIPGFNTNLSIEKIKKQVGDIGCVIASQTQDLAPADKMLYILRNEIGAINNESLIASSILAKKIASGATYIIIDVKYGAGALMKTVDEAMHLARLIINIGKSLDKFITVIISSMEEPLGRAIGNSMEVIESIEFLKGNIENSDIAEITYSIATTVLLQLNLYETAEEAFNFLRSLVQDGKAIEQFSKLILAQDGNTDVIEDYDKFVLPVYKVECETKKSGYVQSIDASKISKAINILGANRTKNNNVLDLSVGIYINKKSGERVSEDDTLYVIYSNDTESSKFAQKCCDEAFYIQDSKQLKKNLIYKIISTNDEDEDV